MSSAATIDRFNAALSWLFFNRHMLKTSAAAASALAVSSADLTRRAAAADLRASLPLNLYPIWWGFASVLATHI